MSKIFTGKTVDEAVNAGLKELGLNAEQVEMKQNGFTLRARK